MYQCRNCGGNIRFDIESQLLKCEYCGNSENPDDFIPDRDAEEKRIASGEYKVTIYTCPQCGAEIINDDTTAATFCDFCGGTAILHSRISNEKCPDKVIPFKMSKKDCRNAYKKLMQRSIFAPSEMKKEENIERFRAIYMPFWLYDIEKNGKLIYEGAHSRMVGDYLTTEVWKMQSDAEITFRDIPFDATSSFADNLSEAITPFDMADARPFTPSYLSGFYADTNDVEESVYRKEAAKLIGSEVHRHLQKKGKTKDYEINKDSVVCDLTPRGTKGRLALMPVWFLSYRNKDRVCYAVVNGQTGKAAADVPIDYGKYLLGSLLLAIPLFFLFQFLFSFQTSTIVILAAFYAILCAALSYTIRRKLKAKEMYSDDIGMIYRMEKNREIMENSINRYAAGSEGSNSVDDKKKKKKKAAGKEENSFDAVQLAYTLIAIFGGIFVLVAGYAIMFLLMRYLIIFAVRIWFIFLLPVFLFILWVQFFLNLGKKRRHRQKIEDIYARERIRMQEKKEQLSLKEAFPVILLTTLGTIPSAMVLLIQPVSDLYYFGVAVFVILLNTCSVLLLIQKYNLLTTRELPQFNKRGGEENE